ncbi:MAG: hypothetical protein ACYSW6_07765 [Planctomycetota bacterium]|jgi:hypothetical protein
MVTKHAQENAQRYLSPKFTTKAAALRFQAAVHNAMMQNDSTAVVLEITAADNDYRDNWELNDRLVGIVRNHNLITVMLSRKSQINRKHLRTDSVSYV